MNNKRAPLLVLTAGILWGVIGLFIKRLDAAGFGTMEIVAVRALTTVVLLLAFLLVYDRSLLKVKVKDIWCFIGTGIFSIVFFNFCYFRAITLTSLAVAAVLLYTAPAFVMLMSAVLFREKITPVKLISLATTFLGCVLVTGLIGTQNNIGTAGILAGLGAGLGYALYSVFSRYALDKGYNSLTISFYTFLFALIGTLPLANLPVMADVVRADWTMLPFCLLFGLVSTVVPYIVYTLGLKDMENSTASIIASIEPVTAAVLGMAVYGERLTILQAAGVLLVIGAIVICNIRKKA